MEENMQDTQQPVNPNAEAAFDTAVDNTFGAPVADGSSTSNLNVEEAFFKAAESTEATAPQEGQPEAPVGTPTQNVSPDARNDERRYQYWQSQAAKKENEMKALQQEVANIKEASKQSPQTQAEPAVEEFPPAPAAPKKPHRYSREEAWSDPSSESARYLDEKETWDSQMTEYNQLRHQYDLAVMQEKLDNQGNFMKEQEAQRRAKVEQGRQINEITEHVQGHYGLTPSETQEFIRTMSDPSSISMDNLVQLFRMNQAGGQSPAQPTGPSQDFQQAKLAQQIPSPMGVMPSQAPQSNVKDEDSIMDELINTHSSRNPWT